MGGSWGRSFHNLSVSSPRTPLLPGALPPDRRAALELRQGSAPRGSPDTGGGAPRDPPKSAPEALLTLKP